MTTIMEKDVILKTEINIFYLLEKQSLLVDFFQGSTISVTQTLIKKQIFFFLFSCMIYIM